MRRAAHLLIAVPFWLGAFAFGWVAAWAWGMPQLGMLTGSICASFTILLTLRDWLKEWRAARR